MTHKINHADIKQWAKDYDGELFDGILCDPPYHLVSMTKRWGGKDVKNTPTMNTKEGGVFARSAKGFMGKDWDGVNDDGIGIAQDPEMWALLYKLLKPGAHLLAFSGSRTYHRMAVAIEDAGFEIRDQLIWMYGSGFPKSLNIGKAVDKVQGKEVATTYEPNYKNDKYGKGLGGGVTDSTPSDNEYNGYGTALKPAHEPCVLARKPLDKGMTVAGNVLKHGTGGLNIDGTRIKTSDSLDGGGTIDKSNYETVTLPSVPVRGVTGNDTGGRFPANLIHDGSDEVEAVFPQSNQSTRKYGANNGRTFSVNGGQSQSSDIVVQGDKGSASRFFMTCNDTQKHAIMSIWNDIDVSIADNSSTITQVIEKVMNIISALGNVPLNIDLVNQSLNALFVGTKSKSTEIDFVAKLVAIKEAPEDMLSQQELRAIQDYMRNLESSTQTQSHVSGAENKDSTDITQITINLLKLCGYVLHAIDENTKQANQESDSDQAKTTRFLYTAKASKRERNAGLEGFEEKQKVFNGQSDTSSTEIKDVEKRFTTQPVANHHPTVKPLSLTKYLATLIKPPTGGRLLVPFSGSGSEMIGALQAGWEYVEGVELTEEYIPIAEARIKYWVKQPRQERLL